MICIMKEMFTVTNSLMRFCPIVRGTSKNFFYAFEHLLKTLSAMDASTKRI